MEYWFSTQPTAQVYERNQRNLIFRVLVVSSVVIYSLETMSMMILRLIPGLKEPTMTVVDGLILVTALFPINFFLIVLPLSRQIEKHHRINLDLAESNEILERFFSIEDVLIAYMDADFNFIRVNQAYAKTDEKPPAFYVGKNHFDLFPNEENKAIFSSVVQTGKAYSVIEKPFEYTDHPERGVSYWDWNLLPVKDPQGQVAGLIMVLSDVTERKKARIASVDSERRFRAAFNQTFQHSALLDPGGKILNFNQTAVDFSGLKGEDVLGLALWELPWWDFIPGRNNGVEDIKTAVQQAAAGMVVRGEYQISSASGEKAVMDITVKPFVDDLGHTIMLIYEARDITRRIQAEEAIKRSEVEIKRLYEAEQDAHNFADAMRNAVLAFSGSLDTDTVLGSLLDYLFRFVPYTSAHFLLLADEDHLTVRLARGEETWAVEDRLNNKMLKLSDLEILRPALEKREILTVSNTMENHGSIFSSKTLHVRSWLGIPLLAGDQVVGLCILEHEQPDYFSADLVRWAIALTGQAAVALQNAWLFDQVRDGREQLQALSRRLVETQENERLYIARELHDEAGQAVASLMIGLKHLEYDCDNPSAVVAHSRELKQMADGILEDLHRLAIGLRPASLDHLGLVAALRQHADLVSMQHGLAVQFETVGEIERLPGEIETAIYRIVQEALTNVIRHAQATRIDILIEKHEDHIVIVVEDNGVGFDPTLARSSRLGVLGMQERAVMLGGTITIESSSDEGSSIILEVPWPSAS